MKNEHIRELFKCAGGKTSTRNLMSNPVQVVETHEIWDERIDKFVELIVRECVLISRTSTDGFSAGQRMEERFGIEE